MWLLLSCFSPDQPEAEAQRDELILEMQTHDQQANAAREALIIGDLDGMKAAGAALVARLPLAELPASAAAAQETLRQHAQSLADAPDIEQAAWSLGELGEACGSCHQALVASVRLEMPEPPPVGEGFTEQMQRYHWAVGRMWQGLVMPSDAAYQEATAALHKMPAAPFRPDWLDAMPPQAVATDAQVHRIAAVAEMGSGRMLGALMLTCASCHVNMPGSPASDLTHP